MRNALSLFLLVVPWLPDVALAQTASERAACQADFEKFCPSVQPGGGRIIECLAEHLNDLTPQCQAVVKTHMPK